MSYCGGTRPDHNQQSFFFPSFPPSPVLLAAPPLGDLVVPCMWGYRNLILPVHIAAPGGTLYPSIALHYLRISLHLPPMLSSEASPPLLRSSHPHSGLASLR